MLFVSDELKHTVLKKYKWSSVFLLLASIQAISSLALLIPTLIHVRKVYYASKTTGEQTDAHNLELFDKAFKISGEYVMFLAFEVWRVWLAIDGVVHLNSKTIWASASSTVLSFIFSILMIAETVKWNRENNGYVMFGDLGTINQSLLIVLSIIVFLITPMTLFAAKKATKDIGWDVYKKIGCSTEIQKMYIKVQWFSLMLKINIYFEFTSYALYFIMLASFSANWKQGSPTIPVLGVSLAVLVLILPSLVMSRYAISRESNLLMTSFIVFQFVFIGSTVYVMYHKKEFLTDWYAFAGYCLCTLVAAIVTIILSIVCQLNFNKGLKDFVRWKLFSKTVPRRQSAAYMSQASTFYGLEGQRVDMPIDD